MNKYDIIFWYTGGFVWCVIALAIAAAVICAGCVVVWQSYQAMHAWRGIHTIMGIPETDSVKFKRVGYALREARRATNVKYNAEELRLFLTAFHKAYHSDVKEFWDEGMTRHDI